MKQLRVLWSRLLSRPSPQQASSLLFLLGSILLSSELLLLFFFRGHRLEGDEGDENRTLVETLLITSGLSHRAPETKRLPKPTQKNIQGKITKRALHRTIGPPFVAVTSLSSIVACLLCKEPSPGLETVEKPWPQLSCEARRSGGTSWKRGCTPKHLTPRPIRGS